MYITYQALNRTFLDYLKREFAADSTLLFAACKAATTARRSNPILYCKKVLRKCYKGTADFRFISDLVDRLSIEFICVMSCHVGNQKDKHGSGLMMGYLGRINIRNTTLPYPILQYPIVLSDIV